MAGATAFQHAIWGLIPRSEQLAFYPAVLLVAWTLGFRAALTSIAASCLAMAYLFVPPEHSFRITAPEDALDLAIFAAVTTLMSAALDRLRASEARFRQTFEGGPIGKAIAGVDGRILQANRALCELLGYSENDLVERTFETVTPPEDVARQSPDRARLARGEIESLETEKRYVRKDGSLVDVSLYVTLVRRANGAAAYLVGEVVDVSATKRAEREVARLRSEWASIVAHDLRQPVGAILLRARAIAREHRDVAGLSENVDAIARAASRLDRMVEDLLDVSRLELGRLELTRHDVDVVELARHSVDRAAFGASDRTFEVDAPTPVPSVSLDEDRISRVMDNLLSNAIKYGRAGTPVVVRVAASDAEVVVDVTNRGEGIPASELPLLFERFGRTASAARAGVPGMGLGLHIVRKLVAAHGGRVECDSTPGATTTFRFALPIDGACRR